ncbi:MAG: helix-turn-helix domain-containing protein [Thermoleophilia bacterium]
MTDDTLLTSTEVAAMLRLSMPAFYNLRYRRQGPPAVRIGGRLRWRRGQVLVWLDGQCEPAACP